MSMFMRLSSCVALACAALFAAAAPGVAAEKKGPPSCAKIEFRPIASGMADGEADAGLYKSRFGKIEVRATVKSGEATDYYVVVENKKLPPLTGALPKGVESCAAQKKVPAPAKAVDSCTGDRFAVLIDRSGQQKLILLYSRQNGKWQYCRAGEA
jgi:uncharacterized protein with FMN-binding domain